MNDIYVYSLAFLQILLQAWVLDNITIYPILIYIHLRNAGWTHYMHVYFTLLISRNWSLI